MGKPITIRFKDSNGKLIEGISENITRYSCIDLKIEARDAEGNLTAVREGPANMTLKQFAQLCQSDLLNTAESVTDVTNSSQSVTAGQALTTATTPCIVAGTNASSATFTDYKLGNIAGTAGYSTPGGSGNIAGTVNAVAGQSFTVTGTITNTSGSSITYAEVGIAVSATISAATHSFLICHDNFTGVVVSNNGTLAVTYTLSFS
jgi:hypothetical protein